MPERSNGQVSKTLGGLPHAGSNPAPTASAEELPHMLHEQFKTRASKYIESKWLSFRSNNHELENEQQRQEKVTYILQHFLPVLESSFEAVSAKPLEISHYDANPEYDAQPERYQLALALSFTSWLLWSFSQRDLETEQSSKGVVISSTDRELHYPHFFEAQLVMLAGSNFGSKDGMGSRKIDAYPRPKKAASLASYLATRFEQLGNTHPSILDVGVMRGQAMEGLREELLALGFPHLTIEGVSTYNVQNIAIDTLHALPMEIFKPEPVYDTIVSNYTSNYFLYPTTALQNILNGLKPGGLALLDISFLHHGGTELFYDPIDKILGVKTGHTYSTIKKRYATFLQNFLKIVAACNCRILKIKLTHEDGKGDAFAIEKNQ